MAWRPQRLLKLCFSLGAVIALSGCAGYQLGNLPADHLQDAKTIFIQPPKNLTTEPGLGIALGHALSRRFDSDGRLKTARKDHADISIQVTLVNVSRNPIRSSRQNIHRAAQYQSTLQADVILLGRNNTPILPSQSFEGTTKYFTQADLQESERQGWETAIEDLADRIVSYITETGW